MTGTAVLRVVRGAPAPEELAALVAVLAACAPAPAQPPATRPGWADRGAALRRPLHPAPRAWAASRREPGTRTRAGW